MVLRLEGLGDPFAGAGRRERDLGGLAAACSDLAAWVADGVKGSSHWSILILPLGVAGGIRLVAVQALPAAPEGCSRTWRWTWCLPGLAVSEAAEHPSSSGSFPMAVDRRRCWRRQHRAARKRRPDQDSVDGRSRGLAGRDTVPCRVSRTSGRAVCQTSGPPHRSLPCRLRTLGCRGLLVAGFRRARPGCRDTWRRRGR